MKREEGLKKMECSTIELLDKHDKGEINDETFLKDFGNAKEID